jgi:hypothetical protein
VRDAKGQRRENCNKGSRQIELSFTRPPEKFIMRRGAKISQKMRGSRKNSRNFPICAAETPQSRVKRKRRGGFVLPSVAMSAAFAKV